MIPQVELFLFVFWKNEDTEDISKLTDLYKVLNVEYFGLKLQEIIYTILDC